MAMDGGYATAAGHDEEQMIEQLITMQQVPVVASLQWETLQSLLRSLFSRLAQQASRIEKAEDQGKTLSAMADDLERSCKSRTKEVQEAKESEEAKLQNWSKMIEERLKGLDDTVSQQSSKEIGLQGVDVSNLQSLPSRVTALEEKIGERISKIKVEGGISDSGLALDPITGQVQLGNTIEGLPRKYADHNKRLDSLEEQIRDLKALVQGISKAHSSDFESIQNICRNLRADFEMRPILDMPRVESSRDKREDGSKTRLPTEVTKEGGTKGITRDNLDTHVKQLEGEIASLATQLANKADRSDLDGLRVQMTLLDRVIGNEEDHLDVSSSPKQYVKDQFSPEQQVQDQSEKMQDQEYQKHDQHREEIPKMQGLVENAKEEHPNNTVRNGLDIQKRRPSLDSGGSILKKFQDLISQKADRSELLQLHEKIQYQRSEMPSTVPATSSSIEGLQKLCNSLVEELDGITRKMKDMEERSDLAVLLSKRLDNLAQPAATIQDSSEGFEDIQAAINEHAERMMSYADSLLQIQTMLASKADAAGLQALTATIMDLNKGRPTSGSLSSLRASKIRPRKTIADIFLEDKIEKNGKLISQLVNVVNLLGKNMLTMSGEDLQQISHNELVKAPVRDKVDPDIDYFPDNTNVDQSVHSAGFVNLNQNQQAVSIGRSEPFPGPEAHTKDEEEKPISEIPGQDSEVPLEDTEAKAINNCNFILEQLEDTLQAADKIKPKADANVVAKLIEEMLAVSLKTDDMEKAISHVQEKKAEKAELQRMKNYIKQKFERAENAMLSGKALLGFKCRVTIHLTSSIQIGLTL